MRAYRLVLAFSLGLWAPGCSFLKPHADPTRYFVLTSEESQPQAAALPIVLGVDHIELPEYLLRPELVTRSATNQLTIAEYDHWGEPLRQGFTHAFSRDLEGQLGAGHVIAAPFDPTHRPTLSLDVEVRRFERVGGAGALLEASWTLRDGKTGAALVTRDTREQLPVTGNDTHAAVAALSQALAALAREIAATLRSRPWP